MKRLKLHKKSDLVQFVKECRLVIKNYSRMNNDYDDAYYDKLIKERQAEKLFTIFACDDRLRLNGLKCLLPVEVRNTFDYYINLDLKTRTKKLNK